MSQLPKSITIFEVGPREGFQIEGGRITTQEKISLINALSISGLKHIQVASFVDRELVPGWADADEVVAGFDPAKGVVYSALFFNRRGLQRALAMGDRLKISGSVSVSASQAFSKKNLNRTKEENFQYVRKYISFCKEYNRNIERVSVQAAFGCNYGGAVTIEEVIGTISDTLDAIKDTGHDDVDGITLADTMGWASPRRVEMLIGAVRDRWPEKKIRLHLHDTRGLGIACVYTALRMGIDEFDSSVGGLGGCPFAGHLGAPGNVATEELIFLCEQEGIETNVDLESILQAAQLAEQIVRHPLPSSLVRGGRLARLPAPSTCPPTLPS